MQGCSMTLAQQGIENVLGSIEKCLFQEGGITPRIAWPAEPCLFYGPLHVTGTLYRRLDEIIDLLDKTLTLFVSRHQVERNGGFVPGTGLHVVHVVAEGPDAQLSPG